MSREDALKDLTNMRSEIIKIYSTYEKSEQIKKELDDLKNEKENPNCPIYDAKPEHTYDAVCEKYEKENATAILNGRVFEKTFLIVNALIATTIAVICFLDFYLKTDILFNKSFFEVTNNSEKGVMFLLLLCQMAICFFVAFLPIKKFWR